MAKDGVSGKLRVGVQLIGQHAWVMQEIGKGCKNVIASWVAFKCSGGWNFNTNQDDLEYVGEEAPDFDGESSIYLYRKYSATDAVTAWNGGNNGELTREELARYGFFRKLAHFDDKEDGYSYLYGPINTPVALKDESHHWDLLASAIPAMSFAAAANPVTRLNDYGERNFNMEALRGNLGPPWPIERWASWQRRWLHSDIRNVALPYVHHTFDKMLEIGEFKP